MTRSNHLQRLAVAPLAVWAALLLFIPTLSYAGRGLQRLILEYTNRSQLAVILGAFTLALAIAVGWWLVSRKNWRALTHLVWAGAVGGLIFYLVPPGERWLHVPLFGLFGFLSVRLFGFRGGLAAAVAVSTLDEVWQHALSDRVGNPIDVAINALSSTVGAVMAWLGRVSPIRSGGSCSRRGQH